ncbi:hypothetical protein BT96DRAFT_194962 [Gymnopus androsaceus JB14]|uniref:Uncharacterized protein n=1 Tax=Gymnopus androsaceus JB14 TaxID=1447944 RepID=A0A6A4H979_9AGAR|nr:hypothetical protein BT96DRAFT_194962 [Gymnopus androsaceus JB14]
MMIRSICAALTCCKGLGLLTEMQSLCKKGWRVGKSCHIKACRIAGYTKKLNVEQRLPSSLNESPYELRKMKADSQRLRPDQTSSPRYWCSCDENLGSPSDYPLRRQRFWDRSGQY